jgi:predicted nucleotidyltransferase
MSDSVVAGLEPLLARFDEVLGGAYAAVLYGSAARGDHVHGRSDVNVLLILDDVSPAGLRRVGPALDAWRRSGHPAPLLLSRREWVRSADAFPIEIADILAAHRLLRGADPTSGITVAAADLRRALERDLASGLMRLRQAWALHSGDPKALGAVAQEAAGSVVALLRGLLALAGREVPPTSDEVVRAGASVAGSSPVALAAVVAARHQRGWKCPPETFEGFLAAVDAAAQFVDRFTPGDR